MPDINNAYDEQILVRLDLNEFESDLQQMAKMYVTTLDSLGSKGVGFTQAFDLSNANTQIRDLVQSFTGATEFLQGTLSDVSDTFSKVATSFTKGVKRELKETNEEIKTTEQKMKELFDAIESRSAKQPSISGFNFEEQTEAVKRIQAQLNPESGDFSYLENLNAANRKFFDKASADFAAYEAKRVNDERSLAERIEEAQRKVRESYQRTAESAARAAESAANAQAVAAKRPDNTKLSSASNDASNAARVAAEKQAAAKAALDLAAADEKAAIAAAKVVAENEKLAAAQERVARQAERVAESTEKAAAASAEKAYKNTFWGSLTSDIARTTAQVIKFSVAYSLLNGVINGIGEILASPFKALELGVKYLSDMEQKANELSGDLANGLGFSKDFANNFRSASEASSVLVRKLREEAAATNTNFDSLVNTAKVLANSGVSQVTKNMGELADLTVAFNVALKASGASAENTRRIMSEIPKLFSGQLVGNEKILTALGLTKQKWVEIFNASKDERDLVERLGPYIENFNKQTEAAKETTSETVERIKELVAISAGSLSEGLFSGLKNALKAVVTLLADSQGYLAAMGSLISDLVRGIGSAIVGLLTMNQSAHDTGSAFKTILEIVGFVATELTNLGLTLTAIPTSILAGLKYLDAFAKTALASVEKVLGDKNANAESLSAQRAREEAAKQFEQLEKIGGQIQFNRDQQKAFNEALAKPSKGADLNAILKGLGYDPKGNLPAAKDNKEKLGSDAAKELSLLTEQKNEEISNTKAVTQAAIDGARREYAARKIGQAELHDQTVDALQKEKAEIDLILGVYQKRVSEIKNLDATAKQKALISASRQGTDLTKQADTGIANADIQEENRRFTERQKLKQSEFAYAQKVAQEEIALAKEAGASNEEIARRTAKANEDAFNNQLSLLQDELTEYKRQPEIVTELTQKKNQLVNSNERQAARDRAAIRHAEVDDAILDYQKQAAAQQEAFSEAQTAAQAPRLGDTLNDQKQRVLNLAAAYDQMLRSQLASTAALKAQAEADGRPEQVKQLTVQYEKLQAAVKKADQELKNTGEQARSGADFFQEVFGPNVTSAGKFGQKTQKDGTVKFDASVAATQLQSAFTYFGNAVNNILAGFRNGGVLGGLGSIGQEAGGILGKFAGALGKAGPVVGAVGSALSIIGSLFTASARRIAESIKKEFTKTMTDYQLGAATLQNTLVAIQNERQEAITKLSGKKGGQDQLDNLLPQFDQQIYQLKQQAEQAKKSFEDAFNVLKAGDSDPLQKMVGLWNSMNKLVADYISAGGDALKAQQYVELSLEKQRKEFADNLDEGYASAIQDAISLNDLLKQQVDSEKEKADLIQQQIDLDKQFAQQRFETLNGDAIERRTSNAVATAFKLQEQEDAYNKQKQSLAEQAEASTKQTKDLTDQIALAQQKVDKERQVFNIASDTAALTAESNRLELDALQKKVDLYQQYKQILTQFTPGASGSLLNPGLASQLSNNGVINVPGSNISISLSVGSVSSDKDIKKITDALTTTLENYGRYGVGSDIQVFNN